MIDSKNSGRDPKLYRQYALLSRYYIELTLYREAEAVATRALELNPRADLARHGRAIARWKLGNLRGATADLDTLVNVRGARFLGVRKTRETVHELLRVKNQEPSPSVETSGAPLSTATAREVFPSGPMDPSWPHPDMVAAEPTNNDHDPCDKNEAGYFRHSPPCFDYNRSKCLREDCPYSHIPDTNSIRGIDGKNVCIRFLLGIRCRKRCLYSHSMIGLPPDFTIPGPSLDSTLTVELQWWNNPARMEEIRQHLRDRDARQKEEYEARVVARSEKAAKAQAQAQAPEATSTTVVEAEPLPSNENIRSATLLPPNTDQVQRKTKRSQPKYQPQVSTGKHRKNRKKSIKAHSIDTVALVDMGLVETAALNSETARDSKKSTKSQALTKVESDMGPVPISQRRKLARSYYPMSRTVKSFQRLTNCGFTDDDVAELTRMGVNPWDDNAQSVLAYLDDY